MQNLDKDYRRGYSCYKAKKKIKTFASHFSFIFIPLLTKTTMSWDFFIKVNLQEAYWSKYCWLILKNFTSHAIKHRKHSIERDVDLHVVKECLKKNADNFRSTQ